MLKSLFGWMGFNSVGDTINKHPDNNESLGSQHPQKKLSELLTFPASANLADAEIVYSYGGMLSSGLYINDFKEDEKLRIYRELSQDSIIATAIEEIVNSMIVFSGNDDPINLYFTEDCKFDDVTKTKIRNEFDYIMRLLKFRKHGYQYVKDWYVDGRLHFHKLVDKNDIKSGIKALVQIDPVTIKKLKDIDVTKYTETGLIDINRIKEYYIYKPKFSAKYGVPAYGNPLELSVVAAGAVASCDSGIYSDGNVISYLDKSIIPYNNLKLLEEAILIYRVARAPERKAFYIDVNGLPPKKAAEYMQQQMASFRAGLKFDRLTGKLDGKSAALSIVEDYWFPRRNGSVTEVQNIEGGNMLNSLEDIDHFYQQYLQSLHVPKSRLTADAANSIFGNGAEITRDEYRFLRFIDKLQQQFVTLFYDLLKTQLICKGIVDDDDWDVVNDTIRFEFSNDNAFHQERKLSELNAKLSALSMADNYVGKYYDKEWVMTEILNYTEEEIKNAPKEIENTDEFFEE